MNLKELGIGGVIVVGGAAYGISQYGLNDVLSEEIRPYSTVSEQERPAYMASVVSEFTEAFSTYAVETPTYVYVGYSKFTTSPSNGTFVEVVSQEDRVPENEIKGIRAEMDASSFCQQAEMTMFTDNGWRYRFTLQDSSGRNIYKVTCKPAQPDLRGLS